MTRLINEALAREYFANENAIGAQIRVGEHDPWATVVGIIGTEKRITVYREMDWVSVPMMYRPIAQRLWSSAARSFSPRVVPPGSRVVTTSMPRTRNSLASSRSCVDFPQPSIPSKVMKTPAMQNSKRRVVRSADPAECPAQEGYAAVRPTRGATAKSSR